MSETQSVVDFKSMNERRDTVRLIVDMLEAASNTAGKTEIVYKANLNFKQAQKYLVFLMSKGLITNENSLRGKNQYRTTEKGRVFMKRYRKALELIL